MSDVIQGQGWLALEHIWMSYLFWLDDEAWATIEPHLPRNQPGAGRVDDRRVISGIIHVLKSGCRWRDCPPEYGPYTTVYNRFNRWSRRLIWQRILQVLVGAGHLGESLFIDSTYVKAHRSAAGAVRRTGDASAGKAREAAKGGRKRRQSASAAAAAPRKSISPPISSAGRSRSD